MGAAYLAGLAEGVWASTEEVASHWSEAGRFEPIGDRAQADALHAQWRRAVERSRGWALDD